MNSGGGEHIERGEAQAGALSLEVDNDLPGGSGGLGVEVLHRDADCRRISATVATSFMRLAIDADGLHAFTAMTPGEQIRAWLDEAMRRSGLAVEQLAAKSGVHKSTIHRALNPAYEFVPSSRTVAKLAEALGTEVPTGLTQVRLAPRYLPVRYKVQAGLWYENDAEEPLEQVALAVAPDPRFDQFPQWLEKVVGDSVDQKILPGQYAHVIDAIEMGYAPRHGDWVVVERLRDDGGARERTIKQVEVLPGGRVQLCPRSNNPRWKDPVSYTTGARNGESVEVRIVGLVVAALNTDF